MAKKLLVAAAALVVVLGVGIWWFVLRDDAPPPPSLADLEQTESDGSTTVGEVPEELDGAWSMSDAEGTFAGFRITESFLNGLTDHVAVGRSEDLSGSITLAGETVSEGSITVDLSTLFFTDDPGKSVAGRANKMKGSGLETNTFPESTFEVTEPIDLGGVPEAGEEITAEVTGELTIHGVTNLVTFEVTAKLVGNTIQVAADGVPVVLEDYEIDKPSGGGVAEISDEGSFEFLVVFVKE